MNIPKEFSFNDYDIIGFDLDNTLLRFNLSETIPMEFFQIASFMVEERGYDREMLEPIERDIDFMQKGLVLDLDNGNILKISPTGKILKAAHGRKFLTENEIVKKYGEARKWHVTNTFITDPLTTWNGPLSEKMRSILDYFDMPVVLAFARAIEIVDKNKGSRLEKYNVYADILAALIKMYKRESFSEGTSPYFNALKENPEHYIIKASPSVLDWLQKLKESKCTFLLTGSNMDFVDLTASTAFGPDWSKMFDIVICFARKPSFFVDKSRPFFAVRDCKECSQIDNNKLECNKTFTQGNWTALEKPLTQKCGKSNPKCLYVGDNLIQDVYTPCEHARMDTVSIVEEILAESNDQPYPFSKILASKAWGSYFAVGEEETFWTNIIQNQSKICVPTIDYLASKSLDYKYNITFSNFYPSELEPTALSQRNF